MRVNGASMMQRPLMMQRAPNEREETMSTGIQLIESFFEAWSGGREPMLGSFSDYFAAGAIWENVGITITTGPDEAIAFFRNALTQVSCDHMEVDIVHIASAGDVVLTERIDRFVRLEGNSPEPVRVMGIFEITGGKISAWRDYFDPRPFFALLEQ
jgi:limonene-1,2-epoxide hydrolase